MEHKHQDVIILKDSDPKTKSKVQYQFKDNNDIRSWKKISRPRFFVNSSIISAAQIEIQLAIWPLEIMVEAARHADACIIPSNLTSDQKIGDSSNRLLTALALGLPVAAYNVLSYLPFSKYYCDIRSHKFRDLLKNPLMFKSAVDDAQIKVLPSYLLSSIEKDWETFLRLKIIE